jgi:hypothetical protein
MQREIFGKARRYGVTVGTLVSPRRVIPKRAILVSATAGLVLGSLVAAAPARAESKSKQVDQITCEEFLAMKPEDQHHIAYWVDGYQTAKGDAAVGVVAFDKFGKPIGALVDECKTAPKETLWQKLKKLL